jgi:hypothetical protein
LQQLNKLNLQPWISHFVVDIVASVLAGDNNLYV